MGRRSPPLDTIAATIAALGVPGGMLVIAMAVSGYKGAAAITTALAALGGKIGGLKGGMIGGLVGLGVSGLVAGALARYGSTLVVQAVIRELRAKGHAKADLKARVETLPVSKGLKLKMLDYIDHMGDGSDDAQGVPGSASADA